MPLERHFVCPLPNGVHARPASALEEVVRKFVSDVHLVNQRTDRVASTRSILAIVSADIRHADPCLLQVSGPDEREAMAALATFIEKDFPRCDQPLTRTSAAAGQAPLPACLNRSNGGLHYGVPVVPGIARGRLVVAGRNWTVPSPSDDSPVEPAEAWRRLAEALEALVRECDRQLASSAPGIAAGLLKVHRSIARDVEFRRLLEEEVLGHRRPLSAAILHAEQHFSGVLAATGSELLRDRALDIQDVCFQLLRRIYGDAMGESKLHLDADSIVAAESLTPGQLLALDRKYLKGLVLARAGAASHTVILARSFALPTLAGVEDFPGIAFDHQEVVLDAEAGVLVTRLSDPVQRYYALELDRIAARHEVLCRRSASPAATRDGHRIEIVANISTPGEAVEAFRHGAEGIGLFRTEMLYLDRPAPPDEAEQFAAYCEVLNAAGRNPVIIRTLDVGGDKKLDYLNLPAEENPFLGCRAVRLYPEFEVLFRTQLRALIRASAHGKLRVMIPMIATADEALWVRRVLAEEQQKCAADHVPFDPAMPLGTMIEVPSAAFAMDVLGREFDFFSVGSNDLLQYFMAADRLNPRLGALYDPLQPSFLLLLKQIVEMVHGHRKEISLCGEMAAQPRHLPLLAGLGFDKLSVPVPAIAGLKSELADQIYERCRELAAQALRCRRVGDVAAVLEQFTSRYHPPLLEPELIIVDSAATTKEEAIKQAVDRLYVLGRTEAPRSVEESVWQREAAYSTGFGHGFAIPHCKSDAVRFDSLVLLKARAPVAWNSLDGRPVRVMILLAIREMNGFASHMKVLTRLARRIIDESFRRELEEENDPAKLAGILQKSFET